VGVRQTQRYPASGAHDRESGHDESDPAECDREQAHRRRDARAYPQLPADEVEDPGAQGEGDADNRVRDGDQHHRRGKQYTVRDLQFGRVYTRVSGHPEGVVQLGQWRRLAY